jgi:O-antigen/teichoic acid export membrane protein
MGHNVGDIILLLAQAFTLAVVPSLMLTYESDHRDVTSQLLRGLTRIFFLIGLPAVAGLAVLARPIMGLLTTEPYFPASRVVALIALGNFVYGLSLLSYTGLQTAMKSHIMARNWFVAGALNILLNVIFIPRFGYFAAAVINLVAYIALLILNIQSSNRYLKWEVIPRTVFNVCVASLIMAGVIVLLIQVLHSDIIKCIFGVLAGIIVYITMLLLLREFTQGEILEVKSKLNIVISRIKRSE